MNKWFLSLLLLWMATHVGHAQVYYDPGFGYNLKDGAFRFNVGAHNIIGDRIGFFYTMEFAKKGDPNGVSDIAGGILRITDRFSVFAGFGFLKNGFLSGDNSNAIRKQLGVDINIPEIRTNVDIGFSMTRGLTLNAGYTFPRSQYGSVYENWAKRNRVSPTKNWRRYNSRYRYRR